MIFKQRRAQYRGREGERTHHVVFREIMGRGRKFSRSRKTSVHFSNFVIRTGTSPSHETQVDCCNTRDGRAHFFRGESSCVCGARNPDSQVLALSRTKPRKSPALHTHQQGASTPSLPPFNMIFSFRCARGVYHVGRERRSARRQARGHFFPETPGRSASRHPGQPIDCSLIFVRHRALYRKKWVRRTWLPSGG